MVASVVKTPGRDTILALGQTRQFVVVATLSQRYFTLCNSLLISGASRNRTTPAESSVQNPKVSPLSADTVDMPVSPLTALAKMPDRLLPIPVESQGRHAEAVDAFQRSLFSLTDGYTRINLMMARRLLELHRPAEAIAVLRPAIRGGVDGSNTYTSRTELHEALAEAFEQAGQRDSATAHWKAVECAWRRADPQFRDRHQQAKLKAGL
jgi:hypothetical protein